MNIVYNPGGKDLFPTVHNIMSQTKMKQEYDTLKSYVKNLFKFRLNNITFIQLHRKETP